jgi:hypothetical protein
MHNAAMRRDAVAFFSCSQKLPQPGLETISGCGNVQFKAG